MLSFGHAVYSGLGSFLAIHALNLVAKGSLPIPVSLIPLAGGLAGMVFAVLFGYVTTKKSGTPFAMITLGIGELVWAIVADVPRVLRRRGRHLGQPRGRRQAVLGITFGPADPAVLPDRGLHLRLHRGHVRLHAHAAGAHAQRGARQPRARGVRRLRHAAGALLRLHHRRLLRRHLGRAGGAELRDRHGRGGERPALGRLPAVHVPGRRHLLLRPHHRRRADGAGLRAAVRVHQGLAAVPGPGVPVHGDVRARRHRQPDHDEPAGGRLRPAARRCGSATWRWARRRWSCCWARRR